MFEAGGCTTFLKKLWYRTIFLCICLRFGIKLWTGILSPIILGPAANWHCGKDEKYNLLKLTSNSCVRTRHVNTSYYDDYVQERNSANGKHWNKKRLYKIIKDWAIIELDTSVICLISIQTRTNTVLSTHVTKFVLAHRQHVILIRFCGWTLKVWNQMLLL